MPQYASTTNHRFMKIRIEFGAVVLSHKAHESWVA